MLVVTAYNPKDAHLAKDLFGWINELDGQQTTHSLVLLASYTVDDETVKIVRQSAERAFRSVYPLKQKVADERGWPMSCNSLFKAAAKWVRENVNQPFLWLEPDATPLKSGWLDALTDEYQKMGKPFMGARFDWVSATRKLPHLNGNAIYPANIQRYNPYILWVDQLPFDCVEPKLTLRHAHITDLIHHVPGDPPFTKPWSFIEPDSVVRIKPKAVLFHRVKDGSLIIRLRERRHHVRTPDPTIVERLRNQVTRTVRALIRSGSSYYHSGNMGDIIYALYAIKLHGGGDLFIGPKQNGTMPCMMPIVGKQFDWLAPLLKAQPYISKVEYRDNYPIGEFAHDLNEFRTVYHEYDLRQERKLNSLAKMHAFSLGVDYRFSETEPWLTCTNPSWNGKIAIHRSRRYRAADFPWRELTQRYSKDMLFVGLEDEWVGFQKEFGCSVDYFRAKDALSLAQTIAGAKACIMNQSFPCAIALGLGQPVFQETYWPQADCVFDRTNFINQRDGIKAFEQWL